MECHTELTGFQIKQQVDSLPGYTTTYELLISKTYQLYDFQYARWRFEIFYVNFDPIQRLVLRRRGLRRGFVVIHSHHCLGSHHPLCSVNRLG